MNSLQTALFKTLDGLLLMIPEDIEGTGETSFENLRWMAKRCISEIETFPPDKTSRWIGFIQGVLASRGLLNVKEERNRTRPFFHEAYEAMGIKAPVTVERNAD